MSQQGGRTEHIRNGLAWVRSADVLWRGVLGDVVVAAAASDDEPLALSGGATLWKLLEAPRTTAEIVVGLSSAESFEPQREDAIYDLLVHLESVGLVNRIG